MVTELDRIMNSENNAIVSGDQGGYQPVIPSPESLPEELPGAGWLSGVYPKLRGGLIDAYKASPLSLQEDMLAQSHAMYDPYRQAAMGAWGDYTGMTTGGEANMAPMSQQYQMEIGRGGQAIDRGMASRGGLHSSGRDAAYSDMLMNAGQGEAARQYGMQLDMQRLGTGALQGLGSAGQQAGSNVSGIYGNQGRVANAMYQNQGANTASNYNMAGNAISGMGQYYANR